MPQDTRASASATEIQILDPLDLITQIKHIDQSGAGSGCWASPAVLILVSLSQYSVLTQSQPCNRAAASEIGDWQMHICRLFEVDILQSTGVESVFLSF